MGGGGLLSSAKHSMRQTPSSVCAVKNTRIVDRLVNSTEQTPSANSNVVLATDLGTQARRGGRIIGRRRSSSF
jgi:hypothetical protein